MLFPEIDEGAIFVHRNAPEELLSSFSPHSFELEGETWPSVEHYFQAMKFQTSAPDHFQKILHANTPKQAKKLGRSRLKKVRDDWSKVKRVVMTRAIYTQCRTHPEIADHLLGTEDNKIIEASQYDYYWGCGRDRRGENVYGQILMDVRNKLREENS